jgi:hypothetical protein
LTDLVPNELLPIIFRREHLKRRDIDFNHFIILDSKKEVLTRHLEYRLSGGDSRHSVAEAETAKGFDT